MKKIFIIILHSAHELPITQQESYIMLRNVIIEILQSSSIEVYKNTIHILCKDKETAALTDILNIFSDTISFKFLGTPHTDLDMMNHQLNAHVQRAAVSSDVEYLLVISGALPIFSNQVFSDYIDWELDINMGFSQTQNSSMILFKKKFTPFFFKLTDPCIKTGLRSLTLFKQYKREVNILNEPYFFELDKNNSTVYSTIMETLNRNKNIHQTELHRLLGNV
ncbi:MAG: hypothetical protein EU530_01940 [Promethearchaeota archaeon]|nr:MAG: hypothetical protein EU530_01940 [Candidatus Lokiarchaeota archaeon]